jgi:hypothetical protein
MLLVGIVKCTINKGNIIMVHIINVITDYCFIRIVGTSSLAGMKAMGNRSSRLASLCTSKYEFFTFGEIAFMFSCGLLEFITIR